MQGIEHGVEIIDGAKAKTRHKTVFPGHLVATDEVRRVPKQLFNNVQLAGPWLDADESRDFKPERAQIDVNCIAADNAGRFQPSHPLGHAWRRHANLAREITHGNPCRTSQHPQDLRIDLVEIDAFIVRPYHHFTYGSVLIPSRSPFYLHVKWLLAPLILPASVLGVAAVTAIRRHENQGAMAMAMAVQRISAFSDGATGGNPAGVWLGDALPSAAAMQRIAADVGFSETAFAIPENGAWRVRYFSPRFEVPFCGHATIALGAALALQHGDQTFKLRLNQADITVTGQCSGTTLSASLQSPPTRSAPVDPTLLEVLLALFGYRADDLDPALPPAWIHAGADHVVLPLKTRAALAAMTYDIDHGRAVMETAKLVTIAHVHAVGPQLFHARNAFAPGGVLEDPATGAAAAAFAGYLRDVDWPHQGHIQIVQGEDMGMRSIIHAEFSGIAGSSIRVSGTARVMDAP
jgi:PhzF family phenazine biosynthesis protein